jgi:hypothetical protein
LSLAGSLVLWVAAVAVQKVVLVVVVVLVLQLLQPVLYSIMNDLTPITDYLLYLKASLD